MRTRRSKDHLLLQRHRHPNETPRGLLRLEKERTRRPLPQTGTGPRGPKKKPEPPPGRSYSREIQEEKKVVDFTKRLNDAQYDPPNYPRFPPADPLVAFKVSEKWSHGIRSERVLRNVPYIDRRGLIYNTAACSWLCTGPQLLATITATVYKRLLTRFRHYNYKCRPNTDDLFKIALCYSLTNNDYWFLRSLEIVKRSRSPRSHLYRFIHKLDANTKVIYDQACKNARWFKSRVGSPNRVTSPYNSFVARNERCTPPKRTGSSVSDYSINYRMKEWATLFGRPLPQTFILRHRSRS